MNLVFLGPPGAGKGTQAAGFAKEHGLCHISTGDKLRQAVADETPVGLEAKKYMDKGKLVPDEVVVEIVAHSIGPDECPDGWILDGFPRTLAQAEALDARTSELGIAGVEAVVYFAVGDEEVVRRLSGRRVCKECGAVYHKEFMPPEEEGVCGKCGGVLYQRDDDKPDTVRNRLKTYREQTEPLIDYYKERAILAEVDAGGAPEEVASAISTAMEQRFE